MGEFCELTITSSIGASQVQTAGQYGAVKMTAAEPAGVAEVTRRRGISASGSLSRGAFNIARRPSDFIKLRSFGSRRQYETI